MKETRAQVIERLKEIVRADGFLDEMAPAMMRIIRDNQERERVLVEALQIATECLHIASDWNAPTHYDLPLPEDWHDVMDADSHEPEWAALYLLLPKLEQALARINSGDWMDV